MNNEEIIKSIIPLWYAKLAWAKELLIKSFKFKNANEILSSPYRKEQIFPHTNWFFKCHGVGIDIYKTPEVGGIDFDFDKQDPDEWRLRIFFNKIYNNGELPYSEFQHLADDEELLEFTIKKVLSQT